MTDNQNEKLTLLLGASTNPDRASYDVLKTLILKGIPVIAIGRREYELEDIRILKHIPADHGSIHTVTLYLSASNQAEFVNDILALRPERIIFNPGTRNPGFAAMARNKGIEVIEDCTLVMLKMGRF
jgi:uncharacterized protein